MTEICNLAKELTEKIRNKSQAIDFKTSFNVDKNSLKSEEQCEKEALEKLLQEITSYLKK